MPDVASILQGFDANWDLLCQATANTLYDSAKEAYVMGYMM